MRSSEMRLSEMSNGAMSEFHLARFNAVREFDDYRMMSELEGVDVSNLMSRSEYVRFIDKTTEDLMYPLPKILEERLEMMKKNKYKKRKRMKKNEEEEVDYDVSAADLFPDELRKPARLDLTDPEVKARIEEKRRRIGILVDQYEKEEEERLKMEQEKKEKKKNDKRLKMKIEKKKKEKKKYDKNVSSSGELHLAWFRALSEYDNHRMMSELEGVDVSNLMSRSEYVRFIKKSTEDLMYPLPKILEERLEMNRNKYTEKKKRKRMMKNEEEEEEVDYDVSAADLFPDERRKPARLDLTDPEVKARIEEKRRRIGILVDQYEKEEEERLKMEQQKKKKKKEKKKKNEKRLKMEQEKKKRKEKKKYDEE